MIELIWPDGKLTTGETYEEVESAMRSEQWYSYETHEGFREDMRKRAYVLCGREPGREQRRNEDGSLIAQSSREFVESLADCELFVVHIGTKRDPHPRKLKKGKGKK